MIDEEKSPAGQEPAAGNDQGTSRDISSDVPSLEEQEQRGDRALVSQIEQENEDETADAGRITDDENMGPGGGNAVPGGRVGESLALQQAEISADADDTPTTRNLLGDNPPGSEDLAFKSGHPGDLSADDVKMASNDIRENFRENIEKTSAEINLDKKLKEGEEDSTR